MIETVVNYIYFFIAIYLVFLLHRVSPFWKYTKSKDDQNYEKILHIYENLEKTTCDLILSIRNEKLAIITILNKECKDYYINQCIPEGWEKFLKESIERDNILLKQIKEKDPFSFL